MEQVLGWLVAAYESSPLLFWIAGSIGFYALATNLRWWLRPSPFWRAPYSRWLVEGGRFFYYVGIPYLALGGWPRQPFQGLVSPEDLGLIVPGPRWPPARWLEAAGTGLALGSLVLVVLGLAWAGANRRRAGGGLHFTPRPGWRLLVEGLYLEVHWAFYRGAMGTILGDLYAGIFWGLGLVYVAWGTNPAWRDHWRRPERAAGQWLRAGLLLLSTLIFFLTQNLWVCLGVHWLVSGLFRLAARTIDLQQVDRDGLREG
ncbi:MAG: hypothetical protein PVJ34_04770 [Anaerolineae bacterium]|jgi:hypothetical protein